MANSGTKDSTVSWTVRIYRVVFGFPVIAIALSASVAGLIRSMCLPLVTSGWSMEVRHALGRFYPHSFIAFYACFLFTFFLKYFL